MVPIGTYGDHARRQAMFNRLSAVATAQVKKAKKRRFLLPYKM
jgi:hypothetical protein